MRVQHVNEAVVAALALLAGLAVVALAPSLAAGAITRTAGPAAASVTATTVSHVELTDPAATAGDGFGCAVAVSGDTVVVGALGATVSGLTGAGAAYVYVRSGDAWTLQATLSAGDATQDGCFGRAVGVSGDTAIVGAQGAAYVFVRAGNTWTQTDKLVPNVSPMARFGCPAAIAPVPGSSDYEALFGDTVENNDGVTVSAAYAYRGSGIGWSPDIRLPNQGFEADAFFGCSVAICGGTAVVGDRSNTMHGYDAGAAYVYDVPSWNGGIQISAADGAAEDMFGNAVATDGTTILVGAQNKTVDGLAGAGVVYAFPAADPRSAQAEITAADAATGDNFGSSVAVSGANAVIGACSMNVGDATQAGVVYLMSGSTTSWSARGELTADTPAASEWFGICSAVSGANAVIGAQGTTVAGAAGAGAAYVYRLIVAPANTTAPTLSGTAALGDTLSCSPGTWTGDPTPTFTYQWLRDGSSISGATSSSYVAQIADCGHSLSCQVTATNEGGHASATSAGVLVPLAPANSGAPAISGTAAPGDTLSCSQGSWTGDPTPTYTYQWLCDGSSISGATSSSYVVQDADCGHNLSCTVTATNSAGQASATSNSVSVPVATIAPANTTAPALSGTAALGDTLSCSPGTWTGDPTPTYTYQWLCDGSSISGATSSSYVAQIADCGHNLSCQVTASNEAGHAAATSNTVTVKAVPNLALKLSIFRVRVGKSVTVSGSVRNSLSSARTVRICRRLSGKLTVLRRLTISGSGGFRWTWKVRKTGKWTLVAVYRAAGITFVSKAAMLTVRR